MYIFWMEKAPIWIRGTIMGFHNVEYLTQGYRYCFLTVKKWFWISCPRSEQVYRHGNHNYFKATFMFYHTDIYDRILGREQNHSSAYSSVFNSVSLPCVAYPDSKESSDKGKKILFFCLATQAEGIAVLECMLCSTAQVPIHVLLNTC
jgi:hypothetical protein